MYFLPNLTKYIYYICLYNMLLCNSQDLSYHCNTIMFKVCRKGHCNDCIYSCISKYIYQHIYLTRLNVLCMNACFPQIIPSNWQQVFYSPYLVFLPVNRINRGSHRDPRVGPVALGVLGIWISRSLLYRALGARSLVRGGHIVGVSWWPSKIRTRTCNKGNLVI